MFTWLSRVNASRSMDCKLLENLLVGFNRLRIFRLAPSGCADGKSFFDEPRQSDVMRRLILRESTRAFTDCG